MVDRGTYHGIFDGTLNIQSRSVESQCWPPPDTFGIDSCQSLINNSPLVAASLSSSAPELVS